MVKHPILPMLAGLVLFAPGCMTLDQPAKSPVGNATKHVKVGGNALQLGEAQKPAVTTDGFAQRMNELLEAQKFESARRLVQRYPDVALEILRGASARQAGNPTIKAIAKIYDEQFCRVDAKSGWAALLKDRAEHFDRYAAHDAARLKLVEHLRDSQAKPAQEIKLAATVKGMPGVALEIDALQLTGEALLLADQPKEAAADFAEALKLAKATYPHQSVKLLLLLSDAQRRAGHEAQAVAAWKDAAELAGSLLTYDRPGADPALWERIAYLRPVSSPWPSAVAQQLRRGSEIGTAKGTTPGVIQVAAATLKIVPGEANEAQVWALIGQWRLYRAEPQGALLAFKHAETFAEDQVSRDALQVNEARAWLNWVSAHPALAILNRLTESKNAGVFQPACAVLGSLLFNEGQIAEAKALLRKAAGPATAQDWPGRAKAEADLGLACLTTGDEAEGLTHLHNAQAQFEAGGEYELLQQSLWNEAAYLDHGGKRDEANVIRQRSRKLESTFTPQATSPSPPG